MTQDTFIGGRRVGPIVRIRTSIPTRMTYGITGKSAAFAIKLIAKLHTIMFYKRMGNINAAFVGASQMSFRPSMEQENNRRIFNQTL